MFKENEFILLERSFVAPSSPDFTVNHSQLIPNRTGCVELIMNVCKKKNNNFMETLLDSCWPELILTHMARQKYDDMLTVEVF